MNRPLPCPDAFVCDAKFQEDKKIIGYAAAKEKRTECLAKAQSNECRGMYSKLKQQAGKRRRTYRKRKASRSQRRR